MTLPANPDVIVVGAGAAGLAAAQFLRQAGYETLVLEAADYIGGRCVTDRTTFSVPFDRGGSWLHSAPINPLAGLAEKSGTPLHKKPWEPSWVHALGRKLSNDQVEDYQDYQDEMWGAINDAGARAVDQTTQSALPKGRWSETASHSISQMLSGDADVTSAKDTHNYAYAEGDWLVEGGLGTFIKDLHRDVPVQLNCLVTRIDYSGVGVQVTTPQGTLHAAHLVLTVSTGVLAAGAIEFTPALPASKSAAIDQLPNGLLNKVGIEFDPEWHEAVQGQMADYHTGEDAFCSLMFGFFDTNLAVGFVAGRFADALELQGAGAASDYCLAGLRATFGSDVIKHVRRTDETAWRGNVHTIGSYSYAKPGGTGARQTLSEPMAERVFFAGEATMTDTYSTVHGAYLSGKRAADQIISLQKATPVNTSKNTLT
jgi:monoamine oxidase